MHSEIDMRNAEDFGVWLHERTNGLVFPADERIRIGAACFHLAQEHHDAIIVLVKSRLYGSAWALARLLLEAYVRGTWLLQHAMQQDLEDYMKGRCPKFGALVAAIGTEPKTGGAWLAEMKRRYWSVLNEYTHGGASQVTRRNTSDAIESAYGEAELRALLAFAGEVAIRVAAELFALAGQESLLEQLREKASEIRAH
jgi:hypothetical protein